MQDTNCPLKIATFNTNSIRSRLHIILPWLKEHSPHILCLQETKCEDKDFPQSEFTLEGYHTYFSGMKSYNGVAILSRMPLVNVQKGFLEGENTEEDYARLIWGQLNDILVVNCYVPQGREIDHPNYQFKLNWLNRLKRFVQGKLSEGLDKIIVCGDFNVAPEDIDVYAPDKLRDHVCFHIDARNSFKDLLSVGLTDLFRYFHPDVREYTFYDYRMPGLIAKKKGWRIDHILVTESLLRQAISCEIDLKPRLQEKPSDHTFLWGCFRI